MRRQTPMATLKSWERASAPVEGYIVPPGESLERPYFASNRALAGTASTGGVISVEEGVLEPGQPGPYRHYHPTWPRRSTSLRESCCSRLATRWSELELGPLPSARLVASTPSGRQ